jgi:glycosyltransferase involved in cell wall biosynthesis
VGGIPDWLSEGVNGYLAPGDPPTAAGLSEAIVKCLHDPSVYARLRIGAVHMARRFSMEAHLSALLEVFEKVANGKGNS